MLNHSTQLLNDYPQLILLFPFFSITNNWPNAPPDLLKRRLRSPKNNLHIKLFMSFILRCVLFHLKRLNAFSDDVLPDLTLSNNMVGTACQFSHCSIRLWSKSDQSLDFHSNRKFRRRIAFSWFRKLSSLTDHYDGDYCPNWVMLWILSIILIIHWLA